MPPNKTKKKQTRLAFVPAPTPAQPEQSSRYSTLTYDNPSLGNSRPKNLPKSKSQASPEKKRRKLSETERTSSKSNDTSTAGVPLLDGIPGLTSAR